MKREVEIQENNKKYSEILTEAKKLLDDDNLEDRILKRIWEPSFNEMMFELLDEICNGKNLPDNLNTEKGVVRKVVRNHDTNGNCDQEAMMNEAFYELKKKCIPIDYPKEINEDTKMETFCNMINVSYEVYEKALSTTKKVKFYI